MIFTKIWFVKSAGPNLSSILGFSSSSWVDASSFGCVVILPAYLTMNFVISSLTLGRVQLKS